MSSCVAERMRHNPALDLADLAVHTHPPRAGICACGAACWAGTGRQILVELGA